jgi:hypothetical protein
MGSGACLLRGMMTAMGEWQIDPFVSLGLLRFGMVRGEPERALGETPRLFRKGASANLSEAFDGVGVHVYYDSLGQVEF